MEIETGDYPKGKVIIQGIKIVIENRRGSERSGINDQGKNWKRRLTCAYGYIPHTEDADGDGVDVFLGGDPKSPYVFVIDQMLPMRQEWDEHKVILGCWTADEARSLYLSNYESGWPAFGAITQMNIKTFKHWLKTANLNQPAASYLSPHSTKRQHKKDAGFQLSRVFIV